MVLIVNHPLHQKLLIHQELQKSLLPQQRKKNVLVLMISEWVTILQVEMKRSQDMNGTKIKLYVLLYMRM